MLRLMSQLYLPFLGYSGAGRRELAGLTWRRFVAAAAISVALSVAVGCNEKTDSAEEPLRSPEGAQVQSLGKSAFFDANLSINRNRSCSSCHAPSSGWVVPEDEVNAAGSVYEGSVPDTFGDRKPVSAAYSTQAPAFHMAEPGVFVGGNFWDGRATGEHLGSPAADQARAPLLNPVEQALPDPACVVLRVTTATYYPTAYAEVWGPLAIAWPTDAEPTCAHGGRVDLSEGDRASADAAFDNIALSIAAFEASSEVSAFTSKFDAVIEGRATFTEEEQLGWSLFRGEAGCDGCHAAAGNRPLFTDYSYANIGIPRNPENPVYEQDPGFVDLGLGGYLATRPGYSGYAEENNGKFKVPTLRNVDLRAGPDSVKAYGHNGYFKSLEEVVHFHNTRGALPECSSVKAPAEGVGCWPPPEHPTNIDDRLGDLGLSPHQEEALVAFLKTLSDGYEQGR